LGAIGVYLEKTFVGLLRREKLSRVVVVHCHVEKIIGFHSDSIALLAFWFLFQMDPIWTVPVERFSWQFSNQGSIVYMAWPKGLG
jgi:hypothetical protein